MNTQKDIERGQIWYVKQNSTPTGTEIWSNRPALVVSNDGTNRNADFVNVVYLTTQEKRKMPYHVEIISKDKKAIALCEQVFAVDKSRLITYFGEATDLEMKRIDTALTFSLGITSNINANDFFQKWVNYIDRYQLDLSGNPIANKESDSEDFTLYKRLCEVQGDTIQYLNQTIATQNEILRRQTEKVSAQTV